MDIAVALLREFGPTLGGVLIVVGTMAGVIRYQNSRLEKAHEAEKKAIAEGNAATLKAIVEGHAATLKAVADDRDRGWQQAGIWQQQAERLAERYTEATQLAADMSDEVLQRRRRSTR